jgi:hypothetical protein
MAREKKTGQTTTVPPEMYVDGDPESAAQSETPVVEPVVAQMPETKPAEFAGPATYEVLNEPAVTFSYCGQIVKWPKGKLIPSSCHDMKVLERSGVKLRRL